MEILFVSYDTGLLDKTDSGAAQRSTLFVKALSKIGHVDVISFYPEKVSSNIENCDVIYNGFIANPEAASDIRSRIRSLRFLVKPKDPYAYFSLDTECEAVIDGQVAGKEYDIIVCRYIQNAVSCGLLKYGRRLVIDADDNLAASMRRDNSYDRTRLPHKWIIRRLKALCVGSMVRDVLSQVKCSFYSNRLESPYEDSVYLHNTTTTRADMPAVSADTPMNILVTGWMSFPPNYYGVKHFAEKVLPTVRERFPAAELRVAGKFDDDEKKRELEKMPGVKVLGFVDDIVAEYRNSRVVAVPLYHGSGTSVKFIEGAAMKRPVVSTAVGARGLDYAFVSGADYYSADTDVAFAEGICALLGSVELSNEMAERAFEKVSEHFSRENFYEKVISGIFPSSETKKATR